LNVQRGSQREAPLQSTLKGGEIDASDQTLDHARLRLALFAVPATADATITTKTIDYGPYTIPAGNGDPHDHEYAGMLTNQIVNNIAKPCTGCTLIGVRPDLVYTDGTKATISQGPMLHHAMFAAQSSGKSDVTCAGTGPGLLENASSPPATSGPKSTSSPCPTATRSTAPRPGTWSST
jgi:hypothetical protein